MKIALLMTLLLAVLIPVMKASEISLTEKNGGKKVILQTGDRVIVSLPSNPSTGYSWSYLLSKRSLLGVMDKVAYHQDEASKSLVGSGGTETWKFKALALGSLKMTFSYARPWEKDVAPIKVILWNITVKP